MTTGHPDFPDLPAIVLRDETQMLLDLVAADEEMTAQARQLAEQFSTLPRLQL